MRVSFGIAITDRRFTNAYTHFEYAIRGGKDRLDIMAYEPNAESFFLFPLRAVGRSASSASKHADDAIFNVIRTLEPFFKEGLLMLTHNEKLTIWHKNHVRYRSSTVLTVDYVLI